MPGLLEVLETRSLMTATIAGTNNTYATIQAAVDAAAPGSTVLVSPGTYPELVSVFKKMTILGGQYGVDARSSARAESSANESIVTGQLLGSGTRSSGFYIGADDVTIDGFTVQGNTSTTYYGAGIVIAPGRSGAHIFDNIIQNNVSGIFLSNNSATDAAVIQRNVFRTNNNAGSNGGRGILTDQDMSGGNLQNVTIDNNAFIGNRGSNGTTGLEAAIAFESAVAGSQSNLRITNNVFDGNGKAMLFFNSTNVTITGNVVTRALDWYSGTLRFEGNNHNVTISNNTLYANTGPAVAVDSKGMPGDSSGFVINNNNFYGNSTTAGKKVSVVYNQTQYDGVFDVRNNYWGASSGPSGDGSGTGDAVYGNAHVVSGSSWYVATGGQEVFSPWSTTPIGTLSTPYWGVAATTDRMIQAEDFNHGGEGNAYHDTDTSNSLGQYRQSGVDIESSSDTGGGYDVSTTKAGEWLTYTLSVAKSGTYTIDIRYANGQLTAGQFHIEIDGVNVTGTLSAAPTGSSSTWKTLTTTGYALTAGNHLVRVYMDANGASGTVAAFNWFRFNSAPASGVPTDPNGLAAVSNGPTTVNLFWHDNSTNEAGFTVERKVAGGAWAQIAAVAANATTYTDNTALPNTTYVYRVRAVGTTDYSLYTNEATTTTDSLPPVTYLSDLNWLSMTNGWGSAERDQSNGGQATGDGNTLTLNGATYAKGLGVHASSEIVYNLNGVYRGFLSDIGVDDEVTSGASVKFQVYADGVLVYDSGVMTASSATKAVALDVTGVNQLRLVVTDAGDGNTSDHADWANARLTTAAIPPAPVAPTALYATYNVAAPTQVLLNWADNSSSETGFKIERSTDGVNFTQIAVVAPNTTSYYDTTANAGTAYTYRVRAALTSGDTGYSNTASVTTPALPPTTYLSDMQYQSAVNGWGSVELDQSNGGQATGDGQTIMLNGVTYNKGLGVHAGSEVVYNLNGAFKSFLSDIGVDDEEGANGSVIFQVYADGVLVFDSGTMTGSSNTQSLNLNVQGVQQLKLVVNDAGDGNDYDHADWAGARLI
ncbi:MAG: NPCBM/NEW2 domain-containing protein [Tepidisphaeraceae bacterium]